MKFPLPHSLILGSLLCLVHAPDGIAATFLGTQESSPASSFAASVPVQLESDTMVGAFQTDVLFDPALYDVSSASGEADGMLLDSRLIAAGQLRVVVYPQGSAAVGNGVAFQVPLTAKSGVVADFPIVLANYLVVGTDANATPLAMGIAPRVKLLGMKEGKELNGRPGIELSVNAQATAGSVSRVEYYIGGVLLGEGSGPNFRLVWQPGVNGPYQVTAIAFDSNGAQGSTRTTNVTVGHIDTFLGAIKGTYVGLVQDDPVTHAGSGYVSMTSSTTGAYTLKVSMGGKNYAASGKFDAEGIALAVLKRSRPLTPLAVRLTQSSDPNVDQIVGLITDGTISGPAITGASFATEFSVDRLVWNAKLKPAPQTGRYTLLLPANRNAVAQQAPLGDGYATMTVSTAGTAVMSGKLPDGTTMTRTTYVSKDGRVPLYAPLYSNLGMASGWFTFREFAGVSDGDALIDWSRPPNAKAKQFAAGFITQSSALASAYVAPKKNARVMTMANLGGNLSTTFEEGGLLAPMSRIATVSGSNTVTVPLQGAEKLAVRFTSTTGLLSGSFVHPHLGTTTAFLGAVFQKQNMGAGYFLSGVQGGGATLEPNPQWTLASEDALPLGFSTLPSVVIRAPRAEQVLPAGTTSITVTGTAADRNGVDRVECHYLHNGVLSHPEPAVGTSAWTYTIAVPNDDGGRYTLFAKSVDSTGEQSNVATLSFRVALNRNLTVAVSGPGKVSTGYLGTTTREVGKLYSITATALSRKKFTGWTGSVTSTARTLSFVMEEGFSVQANFTD